MQILASCSLSEARNFNGKLVLPNEDKKKPDKVFLNVEYNIEEGKEVADFFKEVSSLDRSLVKCVSFPKGVLSMEVPEQWSGSVFVYNSIDELESNPNYAPVKGVIDLIRLDSDFPNPDKYKVNLRDLAEFCKSHSSVRFNGGNLMAVEGLRIGRYEDGKDKMSPVFKDIYDTFVEVDLSDLNGLQEIVKKTRKRAENLDGGEKKKRSKSSSGSKISRSSKKAETVSKLFGGMSADF